MPRDFPEYTRTTGIEPQAQPQGFDTAIAQAQGGMNVIGKIGSQIATDATSELAGQYARKLAQENPQAKILPGLIPSDKTFNQVFREEQYKVLGNQAQNAADKINYEYSKILKPTLSDVESYTANMNEALGNVLQLSDEYNKGNLSRAFESATATGMYQLAQRADSASLERIKDTAQLSTKNNLRNIIDFGRFGDIEALTRSYEDEAKNIESTRELFGDDVTRDKLEALDLTKDLGIYGGQMMDLLVTQGSEAGAKYLRDFANAIPEGMSPSRHEKVVGQMYKMQANYLRQIGFDQSIESSKADLELESNNGILPVERWDDIKNKVSPEQYNRLLMKSLKAQAEQRQTNDDVSFVMANNTVQGLSNITGDRLNKVFNSMLGTMQEYSLSHGLPFDPLEAGADIATNVKATIPQYKKTLEDLILFGDDEAAAKSGSIIRKLKKDNPIAVKGLSKDAEDISTLYNQYRLNTKYTGAEALQQAKNDIYNVSDEERARRESLAAEFMKKHNNTSNSPHRWDDFVAKGINAPKSGFYGFREYMMPSDLPVKADALFNSYVVRFGNTQTAQDRMFEDLNSVYKTTTTNNREEKMAYPPDVALKDDNVGYWMDNDKAFSLYRFVKQNQNAREQPNSFIFNKIDWPDSPFDVWFEGKGITFEAAGFVRQNGKVITKQEFAELLPDDMTLKQMMKGNPKLMIDGKLREVIIQADEVTQLNIDELPSWPFWYLDDNKIPQPIMGIDKAGGDVRWYPNLEILNNQKSRIPKWQQDEANLAKERAQEVKDSILGKIEANELGLSNKTLANISIAKGDDLLTEYPVPKKQEEPK